LVVKGERPKLLEDQPPESQRCLLRGVDPPVLRAALDELLPVKTAAQSLPRQLQRLQAGEVEHLILTRRNKPCGVLITVERYEELLG